MEPTLFVGLDVGKTTHHLIALDAAGTVCLDQPVANAQAALTQALTTARRLGTPVLCVDQPGSIGALAVTIAQTQGMPVWYLPGRRMRQVANTFAGQTKTDARDARIIAEAARSMRHAVRALPATEEVIAQLRLLVGADDDLVAEQTRLLNRLRGLLGQVHPPLERALGPRLGQSGVLPLLARHPTPQALRRLGASRMTRVLARHGSRRAAALAAEITTALTQQTVVLPGTTALAQVIPLLAALLQLVGQQRAAIAAEVPALLAAHPDSALIDSLPGFAAKLTARTLVALDGKVFLTAAQLAAYAGIAPTTRQSGTSLRQQVRRRGGNTALQQAWFQAAYASLQVDRAYYDRKRQEGQHHVQALIALARRRVDVLFAMLRDRTPYTPPNALA